MSRSLDPVLMGVHIPYRKESGGESSREWEKEAGKTAGKDGAEKKKRLALPCGHTFCETCISSCPPPPLPPSPQSI